MFLRANTLKCESSQANSLRGTKVPGSEKATERIGQGPIGRFAPGSELARERKGCESSTGDYDGLCVNLMCLSPCTFTVLRLHSCPLLSVKTKITKSKKSNVMGVNVLIKYQIGKLARVLLADSANWPGSYWPIRSRERIGPGAKRL